MILNLRSNLLSKLLATAGLLLGWGTQITPVSAITSQADWKLEMIQSASAQWWKALTIQTVPGVVYRLQKTTTLESESWIDVATSYGTGGAWVCPLFQSSAPAVTPSGGILTAPATTPNPVTSVFLILEKTNTGDAMISWQSLDDHTPRRKLLATVALDPVWDDFAAAYINLHGNYIFGISPRLGDPVALNSGVFQMGPLDTAMITAFTDALPSITQNIQNNVTNIANFLPQVAASTDRAFYRFSANWNMDTDGDGRFDWQEITLDGNNPMAADSDGDGAPDQSPASTPEGNALPTPTDSQPATPLAEIQQQMTHEISRYGNSIPSNIYVNFCYQSIENYNSSYCALLKAATTYSNFKAVVETIPQTLPPQGGNWLKQLNRVYCSSEVPAPPYSSATDFFIQRSRFRLKLNNPAPEGGYQIPLRIGKFYYKTNSTTGDSSPIFPENEPRYIEIQLKVAAGETEGTPVELPVPNLSDNQFMFYFPTYVTTREKDTYPIINDIVDVNRPIPGPIIENGACVKIGETFVADLHIPSEGFYSNWKIHWQKRRLASDGTLGEWTYITMAGSQATKYEGKHIPLSFQNPGIYQLQALLVFPNNTQIEFPFVRLRDTKSMKDSLNSENPLQKAGAPDFFGVTYDETEKNIRNTAVSWLGSRKYRVDMQVKVDPLGLYNPNLFKPLPPNLWVKLLSNRSELASVS